MVSVTWLGQGTSVRTEIAAMKDEAETFSLYVWKKHFQFVSARKIDHLTCDHIGEIIFQGKFATCQTEGLGHIFEREYKLSKIHYTTWK